MPIEQQIYDSKDATVADGAFGASFDQETFSAAFNTGGFNTQPLNGGPGPATRIITGENLIVVDEKKPAPEPVRTSPPQPDPRVVAGNVIVRAPLQITEDSGSLTVVEGSTHGREVLLLQLRGIITSVEEAVEYGPDLRNVAPPTLWDSDTDYQQDLKDLLKELRRLNELLEAGARPSPTDAQKSEGIIVRGAGRIFDRTCDTLGVGLGITILGTIAGILDAAGMSGALNTVLGWSAKLK